jgi:5-methylcytosine-specific restriction endonuclease McrA
MSLKKNIVKKTVRKKPKHIRERFYNNRNELVLLIRTSDLYKKWRQDVMREQGKKCQICRSKKHTQVHHIIPLSQQVNEFLYRYGDLEGMEDAEDFLDLIEYYIDFWDVDNGILLCNWCHQQEHPDRILWGS